MKFSSVAKTVLIKALHFWHNPAVFYPGTLYPIVTAAENEDEGNAEIPDTNLQLADKDMPVYIAFLLLPYLHIF